MLVMGVLNEKGGMMMKSMERKRGQKGGFSWYSTGGKVWLWVAGDGR